MAEDLKTVEKIKPITQFEFVSKNLNEVETALVKNVVEAMMKWMLTQGTLFIKTKLIEEHALDITTGDVSFRFSFRAAFSDFDGCGEMNMLKNGADVRMIKIDNAQ